MNDIVLIHDENLPKLTRRKGIVVELLKGPDGKMRGAEVRTPNGLINEKTNYKAVSDRIFRMSIE